MIWPLDSQALQAQSALLVRVPSPSPDQCLQLSHYHLSLYTLYYRAIHSLVYHSVSMFILILDSSYASFHSLQELPTALTLALMEVLGSKKSLTPELMLADSASKNIRKLAAWMAPYVQACDRSLLARRSVDSGCTWSSTK